MLTEMPAWLQIRAEGGAYSADLADLFALCLEASSLTFCFAADDEKTKVKKKRLQKSFKSKQRFAKMDLEQKSKADAWKTFAAGKGARQNALETWPLHSNASLLTCTSPMQAPKSAPAS